MLRRGDHLIIGQPAHAWVSGQLARAWGNDAFPPPAPREPVCLAAEQHDVGWAEADLAPLVGPSGRPATFLEYPRPEHVAIWREAPRRLLAQSRYAALLVSLHGTSLYERVDPAGYPDDVAEPIRAYVRGQRSLQSELAAGLDADEVDRNRRLILAWDRLSLALCHGEATTLEAVPAAGGAATIRVEPCDDEDAGAAGAPGTPGVPTTPGAPTTPGVPTTPRAPTTPGAPATPGPPTTPGAAGPTARALVRDDQAVPSGAPTTRFTLAPWPFAAERVVVGCEARRVPGTFADAAALHAALERAPWVPLRFALSPG
jgi:hypothetical protein